MSRQHHYLKTRPEFYQAIVDGIKPFEVRYNDRDYKVGDILHLQEFILPNTYTGRHMAKEVTYILSDSNYCKDGYVIMGLRP
jgi:hypothetical protein